VVRSLVIYGDGSGAICRAKGHLTPETSFVQMMDSAKAQR